MLDSASCFTGSWLYSNDHINLTLMSTYSTDINTTLWQISVVLISTDKYCKMEISTPHFTSQKLKMPHGPLGLGILRDFD